MITSGCGQQCHHTYTTLLTVNDDDDDDVVKCSFAVVMCICTADDQ